jgi:release factor glutamine methyltransferase
LEREISPEQIKALATLIQRRTHHEPLAYIIGEKEFFGLDFHVDYRVLIPRPETELLVEQALEIINNRFAHSSVIADIGTGCGAIAIALALNLPQAKVYATDISAPALEVAAVNCQRHKVGNKVHLLQGSLLAPISQSVDIIVANLPYVRNSAIAGLSEEIRLFEPLSALAGGDDGLQWLRELLSQATGKLRPWGAILIEIGQDQGNIISSWAKEISPKAEVKLVPDLRGIERVAIIETLSLP